jgi:hypothetical protein
VFHGGVDYAAPLGTVVPAATSGTVVFSGVSGSLTTGFGNTIVVKGVDAVGGPMYTVYAHLNGADMPAHGSTVLAGQTIGRVGNTGSSTGPHLHFGVIGSENAHLMNESGSGGLFKAPVQDPASVWLNPDNFSKWPTGAMVSTAPSLLLEFGGFFSWTDLSLPDGLLLGGYYLADAPELSAFDIEDYMESMTGFSSGWLITSRAGGFTIRPPADAVGSLGDMLGDLSGMALATDIMRFREQTLFQEWGAPIDSELASQPAPGEDSSVSSAAEGTAAHPGLAQPAPVVSAPPELLLIESMAVFGASAPVGDAFVPPSPIDTRLLGAIAAAA